MAMAVAEPERPGADVARPEGPSGDADRLLAGQVLSLLAAALPGRVVGLEWRGRGALLTLELIDRTQVRIWRVQVDPVLADAAALPVSRRSAGGGRAVFDAAG